MQKYGYYSYERESTRSTEKDNAKLIIAAPELLQALKYAIKFIKLCPKLSEEEQPRGLEKWEQLVRKITE
jgi:thymidylate synthase ThyX